MEAGGHEGGHEDLWRPVIGQLLPLLSESNNHEKWAVAIYLDGVLVGARPEPQLASYVQTM